MGNAMHSLKTLLQLPCGWRCSRQIISADGITLYLRGKRKTAQCPECLKRSDSVHSCRRRRIQHLPCSGQTLWLVFSVRHYALERMMYRHMPLIRLVASELPPKKSPEPELSVPAASLRRPERLKQQPRKKRHQRWTEVMALHNKGCSFREISRITGLK